jgi:hypothetical protein
LTFFFFHDFLFSFYISKLAKTTENKQHISKSIDLGGRRRKIEHKILDFFEKRHALLNGFRVVLMKQNSLVYYYI